MNETTILLAPAPKAKADFLATVEPLQPPGRDDLPFEVTLDSYTRDKWGVATPSPDDGCWRTLWLKSVDGRRKLPGFLKYLRDRQKAAFGRFESVSEDASYQTKAVIVVPFNQPAPPKDLLEKDNVSVDDVLFCRYALDERKVKGLHRPAPPHQHQHHKQKQGRPGFPVGRVQGQQPRRVPAPSAPVAKPKAAGGKSGLLGNLLGASRRTNEHLDVVPVQRKKDASDADGGAAGGGGGSGADGGFGPAAGTSGAAIAKFRTNVEQRLLDFQRGSETSVKIRVSLADITRDLAPDQKTNVTMDILKFVLYEQADEIGEERWVAAKEPGEFLDEMVVAVYKEGHAPPEVLEEMNKGELPDEIRQQQRALAEARNKEMARKEAKHDALLLQKTKGGGTDMGFQQLNTIKRDRRTIEEIQRDLSHDAKRSRMD